MNPRRITQAIKIGRVTIGGTAPIAVQSMTKTDTRDVRATIYQIKELEQYGDLISISSSREEFCERIQWEMSNDTKDRAKCRVEIAEAHSWQSHVEIISGWMGSILTAKNKGGDAQ